MLVVKWVGIDKCRSIEEKIIHCFLVAMNYQTAGKSMDIYFGRFLSNGNCGYVLKPSYLRSNPIPIPLSASLSTSRLSTTPFSSNIPQMLHIKVRNRFVFLGKVLNVNFCLEKIISAIHLPRPEQAELKANSVDPYVVLQIFGVPRDCDEVRTKTVYHNGRFIHCFFL